MASKFKLVPEPTFKSKVLIPRAGQEDGEIEFTFKHYPFSEIVKFEQELEGKQKIDLITKVVSNWSLTDEFNEANMRLLLDNYPTSGDAILGHYYKELFGGREKNS